MVATRDGAPAARVDAPARGSKPHSYKSDKLRLRNARLLHVQMALGLEAAELADFLGWPLSTVRKALQSARETPAPAVKPISEAEARELLTTQSRVAGARRGTYADNEEFLTWLRGQAGDDVVDRILAERN